MVIAKEPFNAAKYLLISYRLAELIPENPVSRFILRFRSVLPPRAYLQSASVENSYDNRFSWLTASAASLVIFLAQLFVASPIELQDIIVNSVVVVVVAYISSFLLMLYEVYPALIALPVVILAIAVHVWIQFDKWRLSRTIAAAEDASQGSDINESKVQVEKGTNLVRYRCVEKISFLFYLTNALILLFRSSLIAIGWRQQSQGSCWYFLLFYLIMLFDALF
jgi:hypothetical protein